MAGPPAEPAQAGLRILEVGGNAVDAAAAAALVESAVNPNVSGLGGSGAMVIYLAERERCTVIDYNTRAPAAVGRDALCPCLDAMAPNRRARLREAGWDAHQLMLVPGCVAGLHLAVTKYGRLPWSQVVAPAIECLRGGLHIHERLAAELHGLLGPLTDAERRGLVGDGPLPKLGERLRLEPFLELFERLADRGPTDFYMGATAERLTGRIRSRGGSLSEADLAEYEALKVQPIHVSYRGYDIYTPPPTLGGVSVLQALNLLEGRDMASAPHGSVRWADALVRAYRLVWRDRLARLGDTETARADAEHMLSDAYAAELRPQADRLDPSAPAAGWRGGPGTIHVSAGDREGNMVALTQSLIGGGHMVPELGLIVNQALIMFDPRPDHPNAPGPGKRPLVNMSPVVITKRGRPLFALGAPGARHIISAVSQIITNLLDYDMDPTDALAAPRIHCEADGPVLVEACAHESVAAGLAAIGHDVHVVDRVAALGHVVHANTADGRLAGATDLRTSRSQWAGRIGTVAGQ